MIPEIEHLKSVIEGKRNLPRWRDWCEEHKLALEQAFTGFLRLKLYPETEIPRILQEHGISFVPANVYEPGRCQECGALIQTARHGDLLIWCPNGCFHLESHYPPRPDDKMD